MRKMEKHNKFKICPKCNYFCNVKEAGSFCPQCGEKLIKKCPQCEKDITNPYDNYCKHCGILYPGKTDKKVVTF